MYADMQVSGGGNGGSPLTASFQNMHPLCDVFLLFPSSSSWPTNLRPDRLIWLASLHLVYIIKTVPWEDAVEKDHELKKQRYTELAANAQHRGWKAKVRPVEVGYRGS